MTQRAKFYSFIGILAGITLVFILGFQTGRNCDESRGFRLPEGNYDAGLEAFIALGCSNCHSVSGEDDFQRPSEYADLVVPLGGTYNVVKTYGELVTAIIHPSESIRPDVHGRYVDVEGRSLMPDLTQSMTTRQMIDIVDYLLPHYEVIVPEYPANYYTFNSPIP